MSKPRTVVLLLLGCILLSTIGTVHANGCTPDLVQHMCITTNKTTYKIGESVIVTVEVSGYAPYGTYSLSYQIYYRLALNCDTSMPLSCVLQGTPLGSVTLHAVNPRLWNGSATFYLPTAAGRYALTVIYSNGQLVLDCSTGLPCNYEPSADVGAYTEITVT